MIAATAYQRVMASRWLVLVAALTVLAFGCVAAVAEDGSAAPSPAGTTPGGQAVAAARRFLERYVDADGRVVRWDQGGDTVSEGQAYALLLAVAAGDGDRFASVWGWTQAHLQRPDRLLAWHWEDGQVVDAEPATDADLDAAYALLLAARRFHHPAWRADATAIGNGVLRAETTERAGRPLLVAGPWARDRAIVNPSYLSPTALLALGRASGDRRYRPLADTGRAELHDLATQGWRVPPDWAVVDDAGHIHPASAPESAAPPASGFDAARSPVRMAIDCDPAGRHLAAAAAGHTPDLGGHPLGDVSAAGAELAAGRPDTAGRLLDQAEQTDRERPTYYGGAWVALGRAMLTTDLLGGCGQTNN